MKYKFDCGFVSRALIGLLFIVAGIQKVLGYFAMHAQGMSFSEYAGSMLAPFTFVPQSLLPVILILVMIIEIGVSLMYVYGWKYVKAAWVLMGFTALTIIFYHNPWAGPVFNQMNLIMALKNVAIIGGILSTIGCYCGRCKVSM